MTNNQFDIIIIGTGIGGSTVALSLAATGKKILILERGGFMSKEKENLSGEKINNEVLNFIGVPVKIKGNLSEMENWGILKIDTKTGISMVNNNLSSY